MYDEARVLDITIIILQDCSLNLTTFSMAELLSADSGVSYSDLLFELTDVILTSTVHVN